MWRPADTVADLAGRCAALLLACPRGAVVAGIAAAQLLGIWLPPINAELPIEVILRREVEAPRNRAGNKRAEIIGRRRVLLADEVSLLAGLPTTSPARTWIDLAEHLLPSDLVAAGDCVLRFPTPIPELGEMVRRARHRRGVVRAREVLPLLDARSRSRPESHLRYALIRGGLPPSGVNSAIYSDDGEWLAEPDLSYDDARLALEYNGALHADTARMRRDLTRAVDVQFRGKWRIEPLGPAQVFRRPEQTVAYVRELHRDCLTLRNRPR